MAKSRDFFRSGYRPGGAPPGRQGVRRAIDTGVSVPPFDLEGQLVVPADAAGIVLFAHGSGSSRHSPRNRRVADMLNRAGFGTLLFDLLTQSEAGDRTMVFDTELLADRLILATRWLQQHMGGDLPDVGYFGASTGAAAALIAATADRSPVKAVVCRGGRPDLAGGFLPRVRVPTLLIVGGDDHQVLALNRSAMAGMTCETSLVIVPGAGHLFEEPGALDHVIRAALTWFQNHLGKPVGGGQHVS